MMATELSFGRNAWRVTAGLLVWAANFIFIYVFAALACAPGFAQVTVYGAGIVPLVSIGATTAAGCATIAIIIAGARRASRAKPAVSKEVGIFLARLSALVAGLALIAVAFIAAPGILLSRMCG